MTPQLWRQIHAFAFEGLSQRAIAQRMGIHRRTVREALANNRPPTSNRAQRGSIIDPYRGWLLAKLQQYPELSATTLLCQVREKGYLGGYSLVKQCIAELRPTVKPAYLTLAFAPGDCAQVDWGVWKTLNVDGGKRRLSFFVMVLCHSRMLYVEFFFGESMEHWLAAHQNAFNFFNGVPSRVMVDNCKTAVTRPRSAAEPAVINERYADFANHYGFKPVACNPHRPNEKGRVESAVSFVKSSFLAGRQPSSPEVLAASLNDWRDNVANVRNHGTTKQRPVDMFNEGDKAALASLPAGPYDCACIDTVVATSRFFVTVDTNRYSVPCEYAGQRLQLKRYTDRVCLYDGKTSKLIADHPRNYGRNRNVFELEHERSLVLKQRHSRDRRLLETFLSLGSAAAPFLAGLQDKRPDWRSHVARINSLIQIHGQDEVRRALADALEFQAFSSDYIHNIVDARKRIAPEPGPLHITRRSDLLELDLPPPDLDIYDGDDDPAEESN